MDNDLNIEANDSFISMEGKVSMDLGEERVFLLAINSISIQCLTLVEPGIFSNWNIIIGNNLEDKKFYDESLIVKTSFTLNIHASKIPLVHTYI